jgi:hypothetical protein
MLGKGKPISPTTDGIVYPEKFELKLNIMWTKCSIAGFLSLRQRPRGGVEIAIWNKFMNLLGHWDLNVTVKLVHNDKHAYIRIM